MARKKRVKNKQFKDTAHARELASAVADIVEIHLVRLEQCEFERADTSPPNPGSASDSIQAKIQINLNGKVEERGGRNWLVYLTRLALTAEIPGIKAQTVFRVVYAVKPDAKFDFTDESINSFGAATTIFNVWPYWREFMQSMTARAAMPPFVLPMFSYAMLQDWERVN